MIPTTQQRAIFFCVALLLLAPTGLFAQPAARPAQLAFDVASVRADPNGDPRQGQWSIPGKGRFVAEHVTLELLLTLAYGVDSSQIANKPAWLGSELYTVSAAPEQGVVLTREELQPRLQALLQERFHLICHTETRHVRGYALTIARVGPRLTPTKGDHFPGFRINTSKGHMEGCNWTMPYLARMLAPAAGFPVVDQTGMAGSYDVAFVYNPNADADSNLPSLGAALKDSTGLELKAQLVPVETIVIDSVSKTPTEN